MKKIMSLLGIGPKLVLFTLLYSFLLKMEIGHYHFDFTLDIIPYYFLVVIGTLLIVVGFAVKVKTSHLETVIA